MRNLFGGASSDRLDSTFASHGPSMQESQSTLYTAGWFLQVRLLVERDMKAELYDVINKRNFVLNVFLAFLTGLIWLQVPNTLSYLLFRSPLQSLSHLLSRSYLLSLLPYLPSDRVARRLTSKVRPCMVAQVGGRRDERGVQELVSLLFYITLYWAFTCAATLRGYSLILPSIGPQLRTIQHLTLTQLLRTEPLHRASPWHANARAHSVVCGIYICA